MKQLSKGFFSFRFVNSFLLNSLPFFSLITFIVFFSTLQFFLEFSVLNVPIVVTFYHEKIHFFLFDSVVNHCVLLVNLDSSALSLL